MQPRPAALCYVHRDREGFDTLPFVGRRALRRPPLETRRTIDIMNSHVIESPGRPSVTFSDQVREFLDAPRFAVVATLDPDGSPRPAVVWYRVEGDTLIVNSADGRRWPANLRRDQRIALTVEDGYRYVQLIGSVEIDDDQEVAQADIAEMARRYHAADPARAERLIASVFRRQHRVTFRIMPTSVNVDLEGN